MPMTACSTAEGATAFQALQQAALVPHVRTPRFIRTGPVADKWRGASREKNVQCFPGNVAETRHHSRPHRVRPVNGENCRASWISLLGSRRLRSRRQRLYPRTSLKFGRSCSSYSAHHRRCEYSSDGGCRRSEERRVGKEGGDERSA